MEAFMELYQSSNKGKEEYAFKVIISEDQEDKAKVLRQ